MKKYYSKPRINVEQFCVENIVTTSTFLSADSKAIQALNEAGTTQNVIVDLFSEEIQYK